MLKRFLREGARKLTVLADRANQVVAQIDPDFSDLKTEFIDENWSRPKIRSLVTHVTYVEFECEECPFDTVDSLAYDSIFNESSEDFIGSYICDIAMQYADKIWLLDDCGCPILDINTQNITQLEAYRQGAKICGMIENSSIEFEIKLQFTPIRDRIDEFVGSNGLVQTKMLRTGDGFIALCDRNNFTGRDERVAQKYLTGAMSYADMRKTVDRAISDFGIKVSPYMGETLNQLLQ